MSLTFLSCLKPAKRRLIRPTLIIAILWTAASACTAQSTPAQLAALVPAALKAQGEFKVGVRCDYPSRGSIGVDGKNTGLEPDIARRMAEYAFGSAEKVAFTCVTAESRIPFLTSKRVDFLIATLGITPARAEVIAFSDPYFASFGKMLTLAETPAFTNVAGATGKPILALSGTPYGEFAQKCLKSDNVRQFKTVSDAITDLVNGRGFGFLHDSSAIDTIAANNPKLKINGPDFAIGFSTAVGVRKGEDDLRKWINDALSAMQKEDFFSRSIAKHISTELERADAMKVVRRPGTTPDYSKYTGTVNCG
jgi:polar amino acid transport system substrate-binding protein